MTILLCALYILAGMFAGFSVHRFSNRPRPLYIDDLFVDSSPSGLWAVLAFAFWPLIIPIAIVAYVVLALYSLFEAIVS